MDNEEGFMDIIGELVFLLISGMLLFSMFFVRFESSNSIVSGIVYNTTNDGFINGKTRFSVRASENTYVSEENRSTYCLPANSPYKALVNKAARDKRVKVVVTSKKYFAIQAPWTCRGNVTVTEVKS